MKDWPGIFCCMKLKDLGAGCIEGNGSISTTWWCHSCIKGGETKNEKGASLR